MHNYLGLTVYFDNEIYHYDIAEAPFQVNPHKKLKPLAGTFEICIIENNCTDHVRCHDLRKKDQEGLKYFIDEVYEPNEHIVAVLLINSADNFTLDFQLELDNVIVNIPVYIISSVHGDEAIHLIERSSGSHCQCKFTYFKNEVEDKPRQNYGKCLNALFSFICIYIFKSNFRIKYCSLIFNNSFLEPNQLVQLLRRHLFAKEKDESVTSNIILFQLLASEFADEELAKVFGLICVYVLICFYFQNSENILSAVNELKENIHEVFNQEFLFLIVLVSELKRRYLLKALNKITQNKYTFSKTK